jgi:hypothetical protein
LMLIAFDGAGFLAVLLLWFVVAITEKFVA